MVNDNSSRFGKYLEIFYDRCVYFMGAIIYKLYIFFSFEELISFQIIKRNLVFAIRSIFFDCYFKAIIAFLQVVEPYVR